MVDVTNVPSSSTSMSFLPMTSTETRPKVVTQEPTPSKTSSPRQDTQHVEGKRETQEPTSAKEVEPQELVLPHDNARIEERAELHITRRGVARGQYMLWEWSLKFFDPRPFRGPFWRRKFSPRTQKKALFLLCDHYCFAGR